MLSVWPGPSPKSQRHYDTPEQALGYVITQLRVKKNWPQEYVAEKAGYSQRYFLRVERGTQNPTYRFMLAVAPLFDLNPSQLLARAERKYRQRLKKTASAAAKTPRKTR